MRLRLPSLGFCYVALTIAAVPCFFDYLNAPFFFEKPWGSRERDLEEARYLLDIARKCEDDRREGWLRRALQLFLEQSDTASAGAVLSEFERDGLSSQDAGLLEIVPGTVWALGLDAKGWTSGNRLATFVLRNHTDEPRAVALHFSTAGDGKARYQIDGRPTWFTLPGEPGHRKGTVTTPPVPPGSSLALAVGASHPVRVEGKMRGLKFERVELVQ